jgi:hypothetical protein
MAERANSICYFVAVSASSQSGSWQYERNSSAPGQQRSAFNVKWITVCIFHFNVGSHRGHRHFVVRNKPIERNFPMKGFVEFKGYRTRTTYDPESKGFVARGEVYPDFDARDAKVPAEAQAEPTSPAKPKREDQQIHLKTPFEGSAKPRKQSKSKSNALASAHSSATMTR